MAQTSNVPAERRPEDRKRDAADKKHSDYGAEMKRKLAARKSAPAKLKK